MERIDLKLRDEDFDRLVRDGAPEAGDLKMALKRHATRSGKPGVVIAFTAETPEGVTLQVQAVTTLMLLETAVKSMRAACDAPRGGEHERN